MTAKEYLKQYEEACRQSLRYKTEYEAERERIDSIRSSLGGDGMPHGSGISRKTEDIAIELAEAALKWKTAELDAIRVRQEIFELISKVQGIEGEILYERYINLRKWEDICVIVHASWRHTHRMHARALNIVAEKMSLNGTHDSAYDV